MLTRRNAYPNGDCGSVGDAEPVTVWREAQRVDGVGLLR